jgi:hypothetical protein
VRRDTIRDLGVRGDELIAPPRLLTLFLEGRAVTPCPSDIVVRRSVIEGVGGFEESFRGLYEDQVFCAKVCLQVPVFVSTECWDRYRQHAESCTSMATNTRRREVARLMYLNWLEGFLAKTGVEAPEVWQALRDKRSRSRSSGANSLVTRMWRVGRVAFKRGFRA